MQRMLLLQNSFGHSLRSSLSEVTMVIVVIRFVGRHFVVDFRASTDQEPVSRIFGDAEDKVLTLLKLTYKVHICLCFSDSLGGPYPR